MNSIEIPEAFAGLFEPHRYKVYNCGRGSGKSWAVARVLVNLAHHTPLRAVCAREFQNSIEESVHKLLSDQIKFFGLPYTIDKYRIYNDIGSEFIFKGLSKQDAAAIKSLEGADIVWVEEAQNVSEASWRNLTPTVRKDGSEIWVTFNPDVEDAPTYQRFVIKQPTNALVRRVNWDENPWFPSVLEQERLDMLRDDPEGYQNVWEGHSRNLTALNTDIDALTSQIDSGKLETDLRGRAGASVRTMLNRSTEEDRNLSTLDAKLEGLRNGILLMATGVQTDGDALRAYNEITKNKNDTQLVRQRLQDIKVQNERNAALQQARIDSVRNEYGKGPMDYNAVSQPPAAVGSGQGASPYSAMSDEDLMKVIMGGNHPSMIVFRAGRFNLLERLPILS
ncbi:hypothetical protein F4695_003113 [Rhizobium soli]|uniref:Phage terminase large subunit N-terminal domain-containing protein n=1 Tax=Rhizobium soli TaxID=424798 RepID=A0A7X0JM43_9HYPH|nr:hypothetical protein [Rhizobium soli]